MLQGLTAVLPQSRPAPSAAATRPTGHRELKAHSTDERISDQEEENEDAYTLGFMSPAAAGSRMRAALGVVGPEFFRYNEQLTLLREILELESRAEIQKRRKEAEEAATLLGSIHQGKLLAHYKTHGIRAGRAFESAATNFATEESGIASWWNAERTKLSENTGVEGFASPNVHKSLIVGGITGIVLLLWNSLFGIARMTTDGPRDYSIDVLAWFQGIIGSGGGVLVEPISFDLMSIVLIIGLGSLLWFTSPMDSLEFSAEEE